MSSALHLVTSLNVSAFTIEFSCKITSKLGGGHKTNANELVLQKEWKNMKAKKFKCLQKERYIEISHCFATSQFLI